jgi:hypothetical protein
MSQSRANDDSTDQSFRQFAEHPTVKRYLSLVDRAKKPITSIDTDWLKELCLRHGADDVGFVQLESSELDSEERTKILECWQQTKSLVSIVCRMNRDDVRKSGAVLSEQ